MKYEEREGIKLDKDGIRPNKILHQTSKLILNLSWGNLCQQIEYLIAVFITSVEQMIN